jgi:hypothetical protein
MRWRHEEVRQNQQWVGELDCPRLFKLAMPATGRDFHRSAAASMAGRADKVSLSWPPMVKGNARTDANLIKEKAPLE